MNRQHDLERKKLHVGCLPPALLLLLGVALALAPTLHSQGGVQSRVNKPSPGSMKLSWLPAYGGIIHFSSDRTRPAILLFHGLHQSAESWTKPSSAGYNYDYRHTPKDRSLGKHSAPNAGVYKVGESDKLDVDQFNWFDFLAQQGFTVAIWSQTCCTFDKAYISAATALDQFVKDTQAMNPASPPLIALIAHSRGGLLIRKLLKDKGNVGGRVRWVITLHSPHHGSEVAKTPDVLAEQTAELFNNVQLPPDVKHPLKELARILVTPLNKQIDEGSRELAPDSSLIQGLANGEQPVPGVKYYTFGGVNPTLYRFYTWLFTPMSAVPQYKGLEQYFKWEVKAAEVPGVSPMLNKIRAVVPEIKEGRGDSLVTDQSARLPFSVHETDQLNHVEVLWNRDLQMKVVGLLSSPLAHSKAPDHK